MINNKETSSVPLIPLVYDLGLSWLEISTNSIREVMSGLQFDREDCPAPQTEVQNLNLFSLHLDNVNS